MKTAGPTTVTIAGDTWLIREWLELGVIVNLGHGRDAEADIDDETRLGAFRDLKRAIEFGELETARGDRVAGAGVGVSIHGLANFAFDEKRRDRDQWAWARDLCERWAEARGPDIDALAKTAGAKVDPYRSGARGRPTSSDLVMKKFRELVKGGDIEDTLAAQGRVLHTWLQDNHPDAPKMTEKTIREHIRKEYWKARNKSPKR